MVVHPNKGNVKSQCVRLFPFWEGGYHRLLHLFNKSGCVILPFHLLIITWLPCFQVGMIKVFLDIILSQSDGFN